MGARDEAITIAADSVGRDLLQALVFELKLLPKPWPQMTRAQQDEVLDRLRPRVEDNVRRAVTLIGAQGRETVEVVLFNPSNTDKGIKGTVIARASDPNALKMCAYHKQPMLMILGSAEDVMGDTKGVQGEDDQRGLGLGHEYKPDGDGDGMEGHYQPGDDQPSGDQAGGDGQASDKPVDGGGGTARLPYHAPKPLDAHEQETAYQAGRSAARDGYGKNTCPVMRSELVMRWQKGWADWYEENPDATPPDESNVVDIEARVLPEDGPQDAPQGAEGGEAPGAAPEAATGPDAAPEGPATEGTGKTPKAPAAKKAARPKNAPRGKSGAAKPAAKKGRRA
jgi:hypothetical protein